MQVISNQTTAATYSDALTIGFDAFEAISVSVWNETVVMQVASQPSGSYQQATWGAEILVPPGTVSLQRCSGVRFRTNPDGTAGIVNAYGWRDGEVVITGGIQLTGVLAATGVVTPVSTVGQELGYAQVTATTAITAVNEATADVIVTAPAITFDGSTVALIEFYSPRLESAAIVGAQVAVVLYQDGATIGLMGVSETPVAASSADIFSASRRITPAAGARTYSIRAYRSGGNGAVYAGLGTGAGTYQPAYIRITQAV